MKRIASLREKALEPDLSWNLFRLHFLQRCEENRYLDERMLRYADSYTYAMGKMEPRIEEEELIVGLPPKRLSDAEEDIYDRLFETVGMVAIFAARSRGVRNIVLTGNLTSLLSCFP